MPHAFDLTPAQRRVLVALSAFGDLGTSPGSLTTGAGTKVPTNTLKVLVWVGFIESVTIQRPGSPFSDSAVRLSELGRVWVTQNATAEDGAPSLSVRSSYVGLVLVYVRAIAAAEGTFRPWVSYNVSALYEARIALLRWHFGCETRTDALRDAYSHADAALERILEGQLALAVPHLEALRASAVLLARLRAEQPDWLKQHGYGYRHDTGSTVAEVATETGAYAPGHLPAALEFNTVD